MRAHEFITEVSRRDFLKTAGVAAVAPSLASSSSYDRVKDYKQKKSGTVVEPAPEPKIQANIGPDIEPKFDAKYLPDMHRHILQLAAEYAGITGQDLRQLIAQASHETGEFKWMEELGSKSEGKKYFDRMYDIRYNSKKAKKLGNTEPGDGYKYRGRGYLQLTGKDKYKKYGDILGVDLVNDPDQASDPETAAAIAIAYWFTDVKPKIKSTADIRQITRRINSAMHGITNRINQLKKTETDPFLAKSTLNERKRKRKKTKSKRALPRVYGPVWGWGGDGSSGDSGGGEG